MTKFSKNYIHNIVLIFLAASTARLMAFFFLVRTDTYIKINFASTFTERSLKLFSEIKEPLLHGFLSDFTICILLALSVSLAGKILGRILIGLFLILFAANTMHIAYNMSNISFNLGYMAFNKSFLLGSGLDKFFFGMIGALIIPIMIYRIIKRKIGHFFPFRHSYISFTILIPAALLIWLNISPRLDYETWLQQNVFEENIRTVIYTSRAHAKPSQDLTKENMYQSATQDSEQGTPIDYTRAKTVTPNILIVFIESLSQYYLETGVAPNLAQLSKSNLNYSQFIAPQIQTHRGLYSAFCSEYPNFGHFASKSIDVLTKPEIQKYKCLPKYLKELGYESRFIKSARLEFTRSGQFARYIGFDKTFSALQDRSPALSQSAWGIDDKSFYTYVTKHIEELEKQQTPWFIAVVTSGTHPPFIVPASYKPELGNKRQRAFLYADESIAGFLDDLEKRAILDDTLVIITADESRVFDTNGSPTYRDLILNWIPLIILMPQTQSQEQINQPFSLIDLPKTILDYLGENIDNIPGRSALRSYSNNRLIVFGNVYKHHVFVMENLDKIQKCNTSTFHCFDISTNGNNIFKDHYTVASQQPYFSENIKNFIQQNDAD